METRLLKKGKLSKIISLFSIDRMLKFLGKNQVDVSGWVYAPRIGGSCREVIYNVGDSVLKYRTWNENYHNGSIDDYKSEDIKIDDKMLEIIFNKLSEECIEKARYDIVDELAKNYLKANGIEL